ncbi:MAG: hypothetical protein AB1560_07245 [Pseudomonadota bacterium]
MPIWKLTPKDINSRDWEASIYRGVVIIRAESERRARQIASNTFGIATEVKLGERIAINPWGQSLHVSAATIFDNKYHDSGNEGVVGPPEALQYVDIRGN